MWGFTFSRLAHCRGGRQRGSNQQDKPGFPRKKSIIRGTMGGFVRQNGEDWMRLHTRWSGLVCAACLALLIVIRYCCIEVLLEVIVLPASYHQKVLASKKTSSVWPSWEISSKAKYLWREPEPCKCICHRFNHDKQRSLGACLFRGGQMIDVP